MPTKKTPSEKSAPKTKKVAAAKVAAPKKEAPKKATRAASTGDKSSLRGLRSELYSLEMKHAMRELKEVHKLRQARRAVARHLTSLHQK